MPSLRQCVGANRVMAALITVLAVATSILGLFVSKDYAVPAIMLWIASGLLWWNRTNTGKDLNS